MQAAKADDPVFTASEIAEGDEVYNRINGKSYQENENISLEDLRYLQISHYDFDHEIQTGELIVNAELADEVLEIFQETFRKSSYYWRRWHYRLNIWKEGLCRQ